MAHLKIFAKSTLPILALTAALVSGKPDRADAGYEPYLGDVMIVGFNFCPRGWAPADGRLLQIAQNQALYSLLGPTFGGDGRTTFALPDLRGRLTIGQGAGPSLTAHSAGAKGGAENQAMTAQTMPPHSHTVNANNLDGNFSGPGDKLLAAAPTGGTGNETIYSNQPPNRAMSSEMISPTGGNLPFPVLDPTIGLLHCIATQGVFPSRP